MEKTDRKMHLCGVCAAWSKEGCHLPSGNRNPRTGETPCDNFVCYLCQQKARSRAWNRQEQRTILLAFTVKVPVIKTGCCRPSESKR
jgi:hypothetical protein